MSNKMIIAISGKRCSGKTTLAEKIKDELKDNVTIISIADQLKENFCHDMNYDIAKMTDREYKNKHRQKLISYDSTYKNSHGENCWIHGVTQRINNDRQHNIFIIPDVRRVYEYEYLHKINPDRLVFIRVKVSDEVRRRRGWIFNDQIDNHISETDLDNYGFELLYTWNEYSNKSELDLDNIISSIQLTRI